jgi:hypothetical protein
VTDLDIVAATRTLADRLELLRLNTWAERLRSALDAASTGGELVMKVRHHLRSLRRSSDAGPDDVMVAVDDIIATIEATGW